MADGCLDEGHVLAFVEGTITDEKRAEVEAHIAVCGPCSDLTTWAAAEHAQHSRVPGDEGRPFIGGLPPGTRVDRYQILGAVGRGGMGEVYAAYHPDLDRRIALKVVGEARAGAPERRARLLREARAIARLSHPNVITVHDAGTVDDRVYIAMEFVEGHTIDQWLRAQARDWREILDVFVAAARGLAAAHAAGVVHRDFKPQNVMIGHDGSVRVMDFGLARLEADPIDPLDAGNAIDARPIPQTVTRTGALVGTLAYMSPEQFRREQMDPRSDQFSFCVALHEALYGARPRLAHLRDGPLGAGAAAAPAAHRSGAPAWLRQVVTRGLSEDWDRRFSSMDALLAAVSRGRTRVRRRATVLAVGAALVLLSLGGWRLAAARRVSCVPPRDRLAAVWLPGDQSNPRRQAVQRALAAGPTGEAVWQRASRALDDYVGKWSATYVDTCEATHVRGEQSAEVLDLRMACLHETLDEVRALTDVFSAGTAATAANATMAVQNLALLSRCDDIAALRTAIPLPRDERTARAVRELRAMINDVNALEEVGNIRAAYEKAAAIRPRVEALQYRPLLGQFLTAMGTVGCELDPRQAESLLEDAVVAANASHDDVTAAIAASALAYTVGYDLARPAEGHRWARLASASLERTGVPHDRIRSWILHNDGSVHVAEGHFATGRGLVAQGLALKESLLGKDHPDVARSLSSLCLIAIEAGTPAEGLGPCTRAYEIVVAIDPDSALLAGPSNNRAEVLTALGRFEEAARDFENSLRIMRMQYDPGNQVVAHPLHGLGEAKLAAGQPAAAIPFLEQALKIREQREPLPLLLADTRFSLARALWDGGSTRPRALELARAAMTTYVTEHRSQKERTVATWLAAHRLGRR